MCDRMTQAKEKTTHSIYCVYSCGFQPKVVISVIDCFQKPPVYVAKECSTCRFKHKGIPTCQAIGMCRPKAGADPDRFPPFYGKQLIFSNK